MTSEAQHKPVRLWVICHGYPPYYGGAEHVAYYLARAAARSGRYQVTVLTSDIGGRLPARETDEGIEIVRVPTRKKAWARHSVRELISFLRAARKALPALIQERRPDHVLAHFTLPAGALAHTIQRRWGIPYSVVLHGSDVPGYQSARFGWWYPLTRIWTRRIWQSAHRVMAVSEPLKQLANQTWPTGEITVIHNGVDTQRFQVLEPPEGAPSKPWKQIVVVSQLIERKGIQFLLRALAALDAEMRAQVKVNVFGVGPYQPALETWSRELDLSDQVQFNGLLAHEALPEQLQAADLFVQPALQEGLPLSLLEAAAAGCPIVATRVGGIPDFLEHERDALLVPPGDVAALSDAIRRVLSDPAYARTLGRAAQQRAAQSDWSVVWEAYERAI